MFLKLQHKALIKSFLHKMHQTMGILVLDLGGVSKAGITADLEAMRKLGISGAYLMPITKVADHLYIHLRYNSSHLSGGKWFVFRCPESQS